MARMMSRHSWIAAFVGRALRHGRATDPDTVYVEADGCYLEMRELNPEFAADSAFGAAAGDGVGGAHSRAARASKRRS